MGSLFLDIVRDRKASEIIYESAMKLDRTLEEQKNRFKGINTKTTKVENIIDTFIDCVEKVEDAFLNVAFKDNGVVFREITTEYFVDQLFVFLKKCNDKSLTDKIKSAFKVAKKDPFVFKNLVVSLNKIYKYNGVYLDAVEYGGFGKTQQHEKKSFLKRIFG